VTISEGKINKKEMVRPDSELQKYEINLLAAASLPRDTSKQISKPKRDIKSRLRRLVAAGLPATAQNKFQNPNTI
tara:strand:+ start:283 stop:507 length:225 start_codon:yes stop_codon:yes gene_type:complete